MSRASHSKGLPVRYAYLGILTFVALVVGLIAVALSVRATPECDPVRYGDWNYDCRTIYTDVNSSPSAGYEPLTHVLSYDGRRFRLDVLITRNRYSKFFTDHPPTIRRFGNVQYVADPNFFRDETSSALVAIGRTSLGLTYDGKPHLSSTTDPTLLIDALSEGGSAPVIIDYRRTDFGAYTLNMRADGFRQAFERIRE